MKLSRLNIIVTVFLGFLLFASCKQIDLVEQSISIPKNNWNRNVKSNCTFEIKDTNKMYNVYVVLRHTDAYDFSNIWLNIGFQQPGQAVTYRKFNLNLANDAKGWDGNGMNDIWEVKKLIARERLKKGMYNVSVAHVMRQNPLLHIMNVGVRIEKDGE